MNTKYDTKSHNGTAEWPMTMCQLAVPSAICAAQMSLAVFFTGDEGDVPAGHNYVATDREAAHVRSTSPQSSYRRARSQGQLKSVRRRCTSQAPYRRRVS